MKLILFFCLILPKKVFLNSLCYWISSTSADVGLVERVEIRGRWGRGGYRPRLSLLPLMRRIRKSTLGLTFIKIPSLQLTVLVHCRECSPGASLGIPYWILWKNDILIRSWRIKLVVYSPWQMGRLVMTWCSVGGLGGEELYLRAEKVKNRE